MSGDFCGVSAALSGPHCVRQGGHAGMHWSKDRRQRWTTCWWCSGRGTMVQFDTDWFGDERYKTVVLCSECGGKSAPAKMRQIASESK